MSIENYTEVIVDTSTRTKILEDRFDRHLIEMKTDVKAEFKGLIAEVKELSKALRDHENNEAQKHFEMNDRVVKLESERGFLAKVVQTIFATITGGVAGWLAKHS